MGPEPKAAPKVTRRLVRDRTHLNREQLMANWQRTSSLKGYRASMLSKVIEIKAVAPFGIRVRFNTGRREHTIAHRSWTIPDRWHCL